MNTAKIQKDFNDAMEEYQDDITSETITLSTTPTPDDRKKLRNSFQDAMDKLPRDQKSTKDYVVSFMEWAIGREERGFHVNCTGLFYYFTKTFKSPIPIKLDSFRKALGREYNRMAITQFTIYPLPYRQGENYVILIHETDKTPLLDLDGYLNDEFWEQFSIKHQQLRERIDLLELNKISKK
jgi:hypothetical protein